MTDASSSEARVGPTDPGADPHADPEAGAAPPTTGDDGEGSGPADSAYARSLREVMTGVINALPDHATLGELIAAAKSNPAMAPVLEFFTVQALIDAAKRRPKPPAVKPPPKEVHFDEEGNPIMDLDAGPRVIRRRADVPDGDLRVLEVLAERGPQREGDLANVASLTGDQLRIILRSLRAKGHVHVEGSGTKRRLKVTRHGSAYLRKTKDD